MIALASRPPRPRTLVHPGRFNPVRIQMRQAAQARHIRLALQPGLSLLAALVEPLAAAGVTSASTTILGGFFDRLDYCVAPPDPEGRAIIDGNDLPQAPRYVANVTARYGVPLKNGGEIFVYTDWAYRSSINYFLYTAKEFRGRSLTEGGLKLGYISPTHFELAVFSRNITNQIRAISAIDFNILTGMINDPRIIGVEAKFHF